MRMFLIRNIVECNVLYPSPRQTTKGHREALKINGFDFCPVDIMDEGGDVILPDTRNARVF